MKTVAYKNLGCKVNSYELDKVKQILKNDNYIEKSFEDIADIYIINTCTVTQIADKKSRQMIHRAKKKNENSIVIAMGCFVDNLKQKDESIDIYVKNSEKLNILNIINEYLKQNNINLENNNIAADTKIDSQSTNLEFNELDADEFEESKVRKFIKIQDGCKQFCSYCIIPYVRNELVSRNIDSIIAEIREYASQGVREVVLTGIHLSSYSLDFYNKNYEDTGAKDLVRENILKLISEVLKIENIYRIRFGSLEPRLIDDNFIKNLKSIDIDNKFCPEFHLSLQSGSDKILKKMNRHYTISDYENAVDIIRKYYDDAIITTDIIVGFPFEEEVDFQQSIDIVKKLKIYNAHIFKYSNRTGTVASRMNEQIDDSIKSDRSDRLSQVSDEVSNEIRNNYINKNITILVDEIVKYENQYILYGFSKNYIKVAVIIDDYNDSYIGQLKQVNIYKNDKILYGKFI